MFGTIPKEWEITLKTNDPLQVEINKLQQEMTIISNKLNYTIMLMNNYLSCMQFPPASLKADSTFGPIVTMTTIPERMSSIHLAIESILMQTIQPQKIVIYISDTIDINIYITDKLQNQIDRGVQFKQVKDVGPHTKLIYALKDYPDDILITFDDDIIYPLNTIQYLYKQHEKYQNAIICNYARELTLDGPKSIKAIVAGRLLTPANSVSNIQQQKYNAYPTLKAFPYGFAGVLYPPHSLSTQVFDVALFQKLCPTEDDIWFKAMSLLKRTPIVATNLGFTPDHVIALGTQHVALKHTNQAEHASHPQLESVFNYFNLFSILQEEIQGYRIF